MFLTPSAFYISPKVPVTHFQLIKCLYFSFKNFRASGVYFRLSVHLFFTGFHTSNVDFDCSLDLVTPHIPEINSLAGKFRTGREKLEYILRPQEYFNAVKVL